MKEDKPSDLERLAARTRPDGMPIMHQNWGKLLFMHWPIPAEALRPLIPEPLVVDKFKGSAWIAITPFTLWGVRPILIPPIPGLSDFHEINVRTYVHLDGVPGVWFFSLDASSSVAVLAARTFFHLPYFSADISLEQEERTIIYSSRRTDSEDRPADFDATWTIGETLPYSHPGSLEFFLTERYCLYTVNEERLYRCRIFHQPWPLREAELSSFSSSMIESHGLTTPQEEPLLHYAESLEVDIWPPEVL